ncbi:ependymin-related protein 1-like [Pomacea canaliculata]|uniref:ependymin-related protein 1-like n=1 Tax=Pomacea canaliculata TaxID=400727 RepID=UPI000D739F61|nr:ependymin-related protein 1-like [Pomacea canaliculata]
MKMFSVCGLIVLVLVVSTKGQTKYCCSLDQFEGVLSSVTKTTVGGVDGLFKNISYIFYDYTNNRFAMFVNDTTPSGTSESFVLQLYTETGAKIYKKNLRSGDCSVEVNSERFPRHCVPDEAEKMGIVSYGTTDNPLYAGAYLLKEDTDKGPLEIVITTTADDDCAPISLVISGPLNGVPLLLVAGYVNIRPGISDASVFNVPPECQGAPESRRRSASVVSNSFFLP